MLSQLLILLRNLSCHLSFYFINNALIVTVVLDTLQYTRADVAPMRITSAGRFDVTDTIASPINSPKFEGIVALA